jgi:hypothetical protein
MTLHIKRLRKKILTPVITEVDGYKMNLLGEMVLIQIFCEATEVILLRKHVFYYSRGV